MRKCKFDGERLPKYKDSNVYQQAGYCNAECSLGYLRKKQAEQAEKQRMALRCPVRAYKALRRKVLRNDFSRQKRLTQAAVNKLARLLDKGRPCISCSRPYDGSVQFCGSHYLTRGAHPEMRFDLRNIHAACNQYCNLHLSGNINGNKTSHGYRQGLVNRYGQEYLDWLEGPHEPQNYTCEQMQEMRKLINQEIRRIERGEGPSRNWRSLDGR